MTATTIETTIPTTIGTTIPGAPRAPVDADPRLAPPAWDAGPMPRAARVRTAVLAVLSSAFAVWYFTWLLRPERVGNPVLFAVLVVAELFNLVQAIGFWWTCALPHRPRPDVHRRRSTAGTGGVPAVSVDVLVPTYSEPVEVVAATLEGALALRGADVRVVLLDDGNRDEMRRLAADVGARYVRRTVHQGAKAGNINHALGVTDGDFVLVLDCDHVPDPAFLERTLPEFVDADLAFVQTPQYYANAGDGQLADAAWRQQALFFGPIARGKDALGAMFCCGTNVVFRRRALESVGGFPEGSLTEDFELSVHLHEHRWRSTYVPEVLASGLGPEDLASYVSQQHRWARGCVGGIPRVLRSTLPPRLKVQYLLSASYFLTGWTVLVYMAMPVIRILTGAQPVAAGSADLFLAHFAPYFGFAVAALATVGAGSYSFGAYTLAWSTCWVHVHATVKAVLRRPGGFVVTPKVGTSGRQLRPAAPTLVAIGVLAATIAVALVGGRDPATLNNVAFAALHLVVLCHGIAPAVAPTLAARSSAGAEPAATTPTPAHPRAAA